MCAPGKYSSVIGASSACTDSCGVGKYSALGASACTDCSVGKYVSSISATSCTSCALGMSQNRTGATSCDGCLAGTYQDEAGQAACKDCPSGKLSTPTRFTCDACQAGQFANEAASECVDCGYGAYAPVPLTGACLACGPGLFTNKKEAATQCTRCDAGTWSAGSTSNCTACTPGRFSASGQDFCTGCPSETFTAAFGASSCDKCDVLGAGYSSEEGSTDCDVCRAGYYWAPAVDGGRTGGGFTCEACPAKGRCQSSQGTLLPAPATGYWVNTADLGDFEDLNIYRCPRGTCQGSSPDQAGSCWSAENVTACNPDALMCTVGASGPLCGSCVGGFTYSSAERICVACNVSWVRAGLLLGALALVAGVALALRSGRLAPPAWVLRSWLMGVMRSVDSGMLRVVWSTYQIVQSVTWSLDIVFPKPFTTMMSGLAIFSFDFLALECAFKDSNQFTSVYLWSAAPVAVAALLAVVHAVRRARLPRQRRTVLDRQFAYLYLTLSFLVVPSVTRTQLQALDCVEVAGERYLRVDTSVACSGAVYGAFVVVDALLIVAYMSVPLAWLVLLCGHRNRMNPVPNNQAKSRLLRDDNPELEHLRFLFQPYRAECYFTEALELIRRITFIGFLPLVSSKTSRRAGGGLMLSLLSLAVYREAEPFSRPATNVLVYIGQYGILLTYAGALAIETDIAKNVNNFAFGLGLIGANLFVLVVAAGIAAKRHAEVGQYLSHFNDEDVRVLRAVQDGVLLSPGARESAYVAPPPYLDGLYS